MLQVCFAVIIYQGFRNNPITWEGIVVFGFFALLVGGLMVMFMRLRRVPEVYFDAQLKEIRFKGGDVDKRISFAQVGQIMVNHAERHIGDGDSAPWSSYTISLTLTPPQKPLMLAQVSGGTVKKTIGPKDELVALVDSVLQIRERAATQQDGKFPEARVISVTPAVNLIAKNLGIIQKEGGAENFVIFVVYQKANYYIQLAGSKGDEALYAEAAGNCVIAEKYQLSEQQNDLLESLGWQPPAGGDLNFSRNWLAGSYDARLEIASVVMQTFKEVYGMHDDQAPRVRLSLG
jgi:hypothetical protein